MEGFVKIAWQYRSLGLSTIPTDADKQSLVRWKTYQNRLPAKDELFNMFNNPKAAALAVITGEASNNLEVIDFDSKYDLEGKMAERYFDLIRHKAPQLLSRLVITATRSGGYHLYYRSEVIEASKPLARRYCTAEEKESHPHQKVKVLIETRGKSGYALAPPSPGYCFLQNDFSQIPSISAAERALLLDTARQFNQVTEIKRTKIARKQKHPGALTPLDDYDLRGDVLGLLAKHGWTVVEQTGERTLLKRPGDTDKRSSGSFNHTLNYFSVFSTSTEFLPQTGYRPYAVYAILECGGDFTEAARRLAKEGYGQHGPGKKNDVKKIR